MLALYLIGYECQSGAMRCRDVQGVYSPAAGNRENKQDQSKISAGAIQLRDENLHGPYFD
jgi:hypothetical protein